MLRLGQDGCRRQRFRIWAYSFLSLYFHDRYEANF